MLGQIIHADDLSVNQSDLSSVTSHISLYNLFGICKNPGVAAL